MAEGLRYISKKTGIPCVATPDAHYPAPENANDQRILICNMLETTIPAIKQKMAKNEKVPLSGFFRSNKYYIPSYEEMVEIHTKEELENTLKIADMCEEYNILREPILPPFFCEKGPDEHLRDLCRKGWQDKVDKNISKEERLSLMEKLWQ